MSEESKDELESAFLALLIYMRGTARFWSTYNLSTMSGTRLTVVGGWLTEDVDWLMEDVDGLMGDM